MRIRCRPRRPYRRHCPTALHRRWAILYRKRHMSPGPGCSGRPGTVFGGQRVAQAQVRFRGGTHSRALAVLGTAAPAWLGYGVPGEGIRRDAKSCVSTRRWPAETVLGGTDDHHRKGLERPADPTCTSNLSKRSSTRRGPRRHPRVQADDWSLLLSHYLNSDLLVAGMPRRLRPSSSRPRPIWRTSGGSSSPTGPPRREHRLRPGCPGSPCDNSTTWTTSRRNRQEGADRLTSRPGGQVLSADSLRDGQNRVVPGELPGPAVRRVGDAYATDAGPEHCRYVLGPELRRLRQAHRRRGPLAGRLASRHRLVVEKYAKYAVAAKFGQNAYGRDIDYEQVPAEKAEESSRSDSRTSP